ncbi:hypothetical protein BDV93DRAFT_518549 [Ceratobasidium sp. AG-I]|nr:hypothetical protein BDV93DRAFT_518549 [Ceratobasidium sp. AG-I]
MARHRATRPSIASAVSTTSTNGTRSRTKLSYEQNALLVLAENNLKKNKKPLNISAIVKSAERRAQEQGLSLGVRARPSIKKAVEKLSQHGAIAEAPRKGRAPVGYSITPKAVKVYNEAKSHRRSEVGIAKEVVDTLKGSPDRPTKRRRSSVSATAVSTPRPAQQATIEKLKTELATARTEIKRLTKSNHDLLDQQLDDDDDDDDIFGSPTRKSRNAETELPAHPPPAFGKNLSFLGNRPTRPTTPEPTEHGSPEYDAPGDFGYDIGMDRDITPPSSSQPDAISTERSQDGLVVPEKPEMEFKLERLEAAMSELALEKSRMVEEIIELKNQVQHERQNVAQLTQDKHETDLVRVELAQVTKDRDSALKDVSRLNQSYSALEGQQAATNLAKDQLEIFVSELEADIKSRADTESAAKAQFISTAQDLEATRLSLASSQEEARRLTESLAMAAAKGALLDSNLAARNSTIAELQSAQSLTTKQLVTLRGDVQALRDNLAAAQERALSAETIAAERNSQIAGLKAEQEALQGTIEGLKGQKSSLAGEKAALIEQCEAMNTTNGGLRAEVSDLGAHIERVNAQVFELQQALVAAQVERDQLQTKADLDNAEARHSIENRDATIVERNIHVARLESEAKSLVQQLSERQENINRLNATLAKSDGIVRSLESTNKTISTKLDASLKLSKELNEKVAELQGKDKANTKHIGELKADLVRHKDSLEEHQDAMSKLELQLDKLRSIELESLRRRRARIEAEAKRLRDEEEDLTRETIDVDQWDEGLSQSRAARSSIAPSWAIPSSP